MANRCAGRPTNYDDSILDEALKYIDNFEADGHAIPTVAGLAMSINRARSTIYKWASEDDKGMDDVLDRLLEKQEEVLLTKGLTNEFNPGVTKMVLAKHGYSDRLQSEVSGVDGSAIEVDQTWTVNVVGVGDS
jgi:hypothetical protein